MQECDAAGGQLVWLIDRCPQSPPRLLQRMLSAGTAPKGSKGAALSQSGQAQQVLQNLDSSSDDTVPLKTAHSMFCATLLPLQLTFLPSQVWTPCSLKSSIIASYSSGAQPDLGAQK